MKITAFLFTLAAASRTDGVRGYDASTAHASSDHTTSESAADHHLNGKGAMNGGGHLNDGYDADLDGNLIHKDNIRADGQYSSHRNQTTRYPTPAPTNKHDAFDNMHDGSYNATGNTTVIDEQVDTTEKISNMPTKSPTKYPTKTQEALIGGADENKHYAAKCTATVQSASNGGGDLTTAFVKPVGWVGAGPGKDFCNIWKCVADSDNVFHSGNLTGHFTKQVRQCSIEAYASSFCSHTTCTFENNTESPNTKVIMVHSDHREEVGGYHKCGFAKHGFQGGSEDNEMAEHHTAATADGARTANRPACDCICFGLNDTASTDPFTGQPIVPTTISSVYDGLRRQDQDDFTRNLGYVNNTQYDGRDVQGHTDDTTSHGAANSFDATYNSNNFYSSHTHHSSADEQDSFSNSNHNQNSMNGRKDTDNYVSENTPHTQYNENDHDYTGNKVAHLHIDS
jgi:hypothetical protein